MTFQTISSQKWTCDMTLKKNLHKKKTKPGVCHNPKNTKKKQSAFLRLSRTPLNMAPPPVLQSSFRLTHPSESTVHRDVAVPVRLRFLRRNDLWSQEPRKRQRRSPTIGTSSCRFFSGTLKSADFIFVGFSNQKTPCYIVFFAFNA